MAIVGSGIAIAHPGHGAEYPPEEVTDDTSNPPNQNTGTTTKNNQNTKKTTTSNHKNSGSGDYSSDSTTQSAESDSSDQNAVNDDSNSTGVEEVYDNQTNSTSTSSDTPWNIAAMVGVFVLGFGGMVLIFKLGHFGRFSQ